MVAVAVAEPTISHSFRLSHRDPEAGRSQGRQLTQVYSPFFSLTSRRSLCPLEQCFPFLRQGVYILAEKANGLLLEHPWFAYI